MATDTTGLPQSNNESAAVPHESDVGQVHLTQSGAPVQVQVPQGQNVVRVQVTPGETVELPFPSDGLVARLGDNGNLAVKVGDVTVILVGYADAVGQGEITIVGNDGKSVDVAAVLAATDPNLDIQTAAGPGAGDQGTGPDNNGGLFAVFDPQSGLSGLNAIGGLDPTALNYNLIQRENEEIDEADDVDTSPVLMNVEAGSAVNEDDLGGEGGESLYSASSEQSYQQYVIDELYEEIGGNWAWWGYPQESGNDPFDTDDHGEGSQNNILPDDNGNGVDQDQEPLTSTAKVTVNFFADTPGHLSFSNGGTTPVIDQLQALNLTSNGHALQYTVLAAEADDPSTPDVDESHGEVIVAYYTITETYGEDSYSYSYVVFTISIREYEAATSVGEFNIDFTIYGNIDNIAGVADASGDLADALDIDVQFFMIDQDGSVTASPDGALVFTDIDDVPSLGSLNYDWVEYSEEGGTWAPVEQVPTDTSVEHDETAGTQGEDIDQSDWRVSEALSAAGWSGAEIVGASSTQINVSFGADGRAGEWVYDGSSWNYVGNQEAGETVFTGDTAGTYATGYQLYIGTAESPLTGGTTNWTITEGDLTLTVYAEQVDANTIVGYALDGETQIPVFVLYIDPSDGSVTLVQVHQINHADSTDADDVTESLLIDGVEVVVRATDYDGDYVETPLNVTVRDDGPTIAVSAEGECEVILETQDAQTEGSSKDTAVSSANFSGVFSWSKDAGADGEASSSLVYALSLKVAEGTASGLTIGGQTIYLFINGNVVTGSTSATEGGVSSGNTVFTISVNSSTGVVTLTQYQQVDHANAESSPSYDDDVQSLASGLVALTATGTVTDKDGDSATDSASIDLGGNIRFDDDGPCVDVSANKESSVILETQDAQTEGSAKDTAVSSANFSGVFSWSKDAGADGEASSSLVYALSLKVAEGTASGLTIGGQTIYLFINGNVVTGSTSATEGGVSSGNTVFTISVNSSTGVVTLTQYQQVDHANAESSPSYDDDVQSLASGLVALTATGTVTDKDGDSATDSASIDLGGNIRFDDDGPNATSDGAFVIAGLNDTATPEISYDAVSGLLANDDFGADGAGSITQVEYNGTAYFPVGGIIAIPVDGGVLTVGTDGSWSYDQSSAVSEGTIVNLTYTIVDGDGDTDTASFSVTPSSIDKPEFSVATIKLDEDGLVGNAGDQSGNGDDEQDAGDSGDGLTLPGDGRGTEAVWQQAIAVDWNGSAGTMWVGPAEQSGGYLMDGSGNYVLTADGERIVVASSNQGTHFQMVGYAESDTTFSSPIIVIDITNEGVLTVNLYQALAQSDGGAENNLTFDIVVHADNAAGSSAQVVTVDIDDDIAVANNDADTVSEGAGNTATGNVISGDGTVDGLGGSGSDQTGADGAKVTALSGLTSDGNGADGFAVAGIYGTLTMDSAGNYTYTLTAASVPAGAKEVFTYTLTDADGDADTATLTINIDQDARVPSVDSSEVLVDEKGLANGSDAGSDSETGTGSFFITIEETLTALTIGGVPVNLGGSFPQNIIVSGLGILTVTGVTAVAGGYTVSYSYTLADNVTTHATQGKDDTVDGPSFEVIATDATGDSSNATIQVVISDDAPTAEDDAFGQVNAVTASAVTLGNVFVDNGSGADAAGADGLASNAISTVAAGLGGGTVSRDATSGWDITIADKGVIHVSSSGEVTFTAIDGNSISTDGEDFTFSYTIVDNDGDTSTATVSFNVKGEIVDGFVVGENVSDTPTTEGASTTDDDHRIDDTDNAPDGSIDGGTGNDLLIGDVGGSETIVTPGQNYNIVLIADTSGSMTNGDVDRLALMKSALINLVTQLAGFTGTINISLIGFSSDASTKITIYDLDTTKLQSLIDAINALSSDGSTNYQAAFTEALSVMNAMDAANSGAYAGYQDVVYFLTDGNPTTYTGASSGPGGPGGGGSGGNSVDYADMYNGLLAYQALLAAQSSAKVYAIGMGDGVSEDNLRFFDNTDSTGTATYTNDGSSFTATIGEPLIVEDSDDLTAALIGGSSSTNVEAVGDDIINGGAGNDVMLGDSIYYGSADAGWDAFKAAHPGLTDAELKALILADIDTYAQEGTVGGDDTLNGGAGDDIMFGQGGDDALTGGTGADRLVGGTGNDTYVFAAGDGDDTIEEAKGSADTIVISDAAGTLPTLAQVGNDLFVTYNGGETIVVKDHFLNYVDATDNQQVEFLNYNGTLYTIVGTSLVVPALSVGDVVVSEGDTVTITVSLSAPASVPVTVLLYTTTGSAGSSDFSQSYNGLGNAITVTIPAGSTTATVTLTTTEDLIVEGNETFTVTLASASGAAIADGSATVTISNDDTLPTLTTGALAIQSDPSQNTVPSATAPTTNNTINVSGSGNSSGTSSNDQINGGSSANNLSGGDGNDAIYGNNGNDTLSGGSGNDYLDGGAGNDSMTGGAGNDSFVVDATNDTVSEDASGGTDTVFASVTYTIADTDVERLELTGSSNINGTGNSSANEIYGNSGNNTLSALGGHDYVDGGAGNDTINGGDGNDTLFGGTGNDTINGDADNDWLLGGTGNDTLSGGAGNDVIVGGDGNDAMSGGTGDDIFKSVDSSDLSSGSIDGGDGTDLVQLHNLSSFTSSNTSHISSVEVLDFEGGSGTSVSLDYASVISMTDSDHILAVRGDATDSFNTSGWTEVATGVAGDDGRTYTAYQATGASGVATLFVEESIPTT